MEVEPKRDKAGWPLLNVVNVGGVLVILILLISTNFASRLFEERTEPRPPESVVQSLNDPITGYSETVEWVPGIRWNDPRSFKTRPGDDDLNKKQIVHLEVQMRPDSGFLIIVRVTGESPSSIVIPPKNGDFDYQTVTDELFKIKQAYEARQEIYLAAEDEVPYGKVLKAVSACRDKEVEGGGQRMTYPLFPVVHFMDLPSSDQRPTTHD